MRPEHEQFGHSLVQIKKKEDSDQIDPAYFAQEQMPEEYKPWEDKEDQ